MKDQQTGPVQGRFPAPDKENRRESEGERRGEGELALQILLNSSPPN